MTKRNWYVDTYIYTLCIYYIKQGQSYTILMRNLKVYIYSRLLLNNFLVIVIFYSNNSDHLNMCSHGILFIN